MQEVLGHVPRHVPVAHVQEHLGSLSANNYSKDIGVCTLSAAVQTAPHVHVAARPFSGRPAVLDGGSHQGRGHARPEPQPPAHLRSSTSRRRVIGDRETTAAGLLNKMDGKKSCQFTCSVSTPIVSSPAAACAARTGSRVRMPCTWDAMCVRCRARGTRARKSTFAPRRASAGRARGA